MVTTESDPLSDVIESSQNTLVAEITVMLLCVITVADVQRLVGADEKTSHKHIVEDCQQNICRFLYNQRK